MSSEARMIIDSFRWLYLYAEIVVVTDMLKEWDSKIKERGFVYAQ